MSEYYAVSFKDPGVGELYPHTYLYYEYSAIPTALTNNASNKVTETCGNEWGKVPNAGTIRIRKLEQCEKTITKIDIHTSDEQVSMLIIHTVSMAEFPNMGKHIT